MIAGAAPAAASTELRMPSLGADMEYGTLVKWHVGPGDTVQRGDVVAEVETHKGVFSIDVREAGVVEELLVPEESRVPVGTPLVRLRAVSAQPAGVDRVADVAAGPPEVRIEQARATVAPAPAPPLPSATPTATTPLAAAGAHRAEPLQRRRLRVSPLARRMAQELGVDLRQVSGSGEGGAITKRDIERAAAARIGAEAPPPAPPRAAPPAAPPAPPPAAPPAAPPRPTLPSIAAERAQGMRQAIAAAMARSKREIPHYYLSEIVNLGSAMAWLRETNGARDVTQRLLPAALLLKSVALALRKFGEFNGHFVDGAFHPSQRVHLGVAIALRGGGLVAPAMHDADERTLDDLGAALLDLVTRARTGGLRTSEMTDPTITVTSLGDAGAQAVFGVIYPPQVAIVGFGSIRERPWAEDGMVGVRPLVTVSLAADHRVSDGHRGALFLAEIARVLQQPEAL